MAEIYGGLAGNYHLRENFSISLLKLNFFARPKVSTSKLNSGVSRVEEMFVLNVILSNFLFTVLHPLTHFASPHVPEILFNILRRINSLLTLNICFWRHALRCEFFESIESVTFLPSFWDSLFASCFPGMKCAYLPLFPNWQPCILFHETLFALVQNLWA